ncbi:MAG: DNA-directed RNA polymerase subunit E'' [Candidatus Altiarchaeota archaeon]|nr:DNA-directed RNA polymerase subunit E'' [Candidatus Altiarchaeota archaeon]
MVSKSKVCRKCRVFVSGKKCSTCGETDFSTTYAGIAVIMDPNKSEVAKKMDVSIPGKYALKVR